MGNGAVGFVYSERFLDHEAGVGHPERPDRLRAILRGLVKNGLLERLEPLKFSEAEPETIALVHDPAYVQIVELACTKEFGWIGSMDTGICASSYDVARLAVGGVLEAADRVAALDVRRAFCAVRPPGHHAEVGQAMGFCLFNNIALAAEHLIRRRGVERVAVVDFDVHHGNGTQHTFEERPDVLFISLHEGPQFLYPGTGWAGETGRGGGEGYTVNIPMPPGATDDDYERAFAAKVIPRLDGFEPAVILVSAGFDAAAGESIAHLSLSPRGFAGMTRSLVEAAERHAGGRIVSVLEGGYELPNLEDCVSAHVEALLHGPAPSGPS